MFVNMMMLSPATMAPAVSASNSAATAIIAGAADVTKTFATATATATTTAVAATTTAAAKTAVRACAAAASAFGAALAVLWARCLLALQRLFGLVASPQDVKLCTCKCTCSTVPTVPSANTTVDSVVTVTTTDAAENIVVPRDPSALVDLPTESDTSPTASPDCAARVEGLANEPQEEEEEAHVEELASKPEEEEEAHVEEFASKPEEEEARADELANEPEEEKEPARKLVLPRKFSNALEDEEEPAQEIVLPREVAEHVVAVDDPLMMALVEELIVRHEALGPVPRDTVLQLISCLHAPYSDRASAEGFEDPVAMVDVALCMLEVRTFDVAATYKRLSINWPRRVRMAHMRIEVAKDRARLGRLLKGRFPKLMDAAGVPPS